MKRVKRMEIVVDPLAVPKVLGALEASGPSGWTVVRDVTCCTDRPVTPRSGGRPRCRSR
jgi:hypothetical protein